MMLNSKVKTATASSIEPSHSPIRVAVFIELFAAESAGSASVSGQI
jgi:hypothetical protein